MATALPIYPTSLEFEDLDTTLRQPIGRYRNGLLLDRIEMATQNFDQWLEQHEGSPLNVVIMAQGATSSVTDPLAHVSKFLGHIERRMGPGQMTTSFSLVLQLAGLSLPGDLAKAMPLTDSLVGSLSFVGCSFKHLDGTPRNPNTFISISSLDEGILESASELEPYSHTRETRSTKVVICISSLDDLCLLKHVTQVPCNLRELVIELNGALGEESLTDFQYIDLRRCPRLQKLSVLARTKTSAGHENMPSASSNMVLAVAANILPSRPPNYSSSYKGWLNTIEINLRQESSLPSQSPALTRQLRNLQDRLVALDASHTITDNGIKPIMIRGLKAEESTRHVGADDTVCASSG